jgi:tetratricopeptide (TPR) repeat protein/Tfp pilus assembly protein PilF
LKWPRKQYKAIRLSSAAALAALGLAFSARAELEDWVQHAEADSPAIAALFRSMALPGGPVLFRVSPKKSRPALTTLIAAAPTNAELVALRAHEAEFQLDFAAAEADWKRYAELAADRGEGALALADFYHRRLRPLDEVKALSAAAEAPPAKNERWKPASEQRSWRAFERSLALVQDQLLAPQVGIAQYRAWIARYPRERQLYAQYLEYLKARKQFSAFDELIAMYGKAFSGDEVFPVTARASIEAARGNLASALAIFDRAYQPLWPSELLKSYFATLEQAHASRTFLDDARRALAANPDDLHAATRIFHYYREKNNPTAAQRVLDEYRLSKESRKASWKADELLTLAKLFESVSAYNESARAWYALYSLPGAGAASQEKSLAGLTGILLTAPEQPIRFGAGDLSFYRDVATMDPYPGFLNGILSLVLNSTLPAENYAAQDASSVAYFHRARAAELVALFDSRFPKSPSRADLDSKLVEACAAYGASDGVIKAGREFLATFPAASQRTRVSLLMADAYARKKETAQEFAIYDALLKELAARADGVPLGGGAGTAQPAESPASSAVEIPGVEREESVDQPEERRFHRRRADSGAARSPEYARVLDRYLSRLVSMKQLPQALALYRREIDRNPDDPGLYERLAAFLDQNRMGKQVDEVYRQAMAKFPDLSWRSKLARWYLRYKQADEFEKLTAGVVKTFSGTELEEYFRQVAGRGPLDPLLYRQVNLYAHQRFPHDMVFVKNLIGAYQERGTLDATARERLLRENWFYDDDLRSRFFEFLASAGKLSSELEALKKTHPAAATNPAAAHFVAEGEAWRSHFEAAGPGFSALAAEYPGDVGLGNTAASLERSLAAYDSHHIAAAAAIEENLHRYEPRNHAPLTRIGEIYADRELFPSARPYWNGIARISPGKADGYLEAATVFWDYYLYDDALRLMEEGRKTLSAPALYAYEAGAVYENKRDYTHAMEEYAKGALAAGGTAARPAGRWARSREVPGDETYSAARDRLIELSKRRAQRALGDQITVKLASGLNPDPAAVSLRAEVLEAQQRRDDLEKFLTFLTARTTSLELVARIGVLAEQQGFDSVRELTLQRQIAITTDRVDLMRARLALMRYYEARKQIDAAHRTIEALYNENPRIAGIVRATVDFYWRNKMPDRAIDVLTRAAAASHPELKKEFTLEAALKATQSGSYQRARDLLAPLLAGEPFRGDYLAAMARTYADAGDYPALRDFYTAKIQALRQAAMPLEERTTQIAALRRGLIPALTRLSDPAAAVDEYIEIVKAYPEDEALTMEAANYAEKYKQQQRLVAYFTKAVADSPSNYRWPMVLARLETHYEDFPAAIATYSKASAIRPDRTDLLIARAALEERLMRFDEAAATCAKLYDLTYHNPQWMEKAAEIRARQGQNAVAAAALQKALIEGRADQADRYFEAAAQLEKWNLATEARPFAERGMELAGESLIANYSGGAETYARIMTRLRQQETAFARLVKAYDPSADHPLAVSSLGQFGCCERNAFSTLGEAVRNYFTPEEKTAFEGFLEKQKAADTAWHGAVLMTARAAGLNDLEARCLAEDMPAYAQHANTSYFPQSDLTALQSERMRFAELGRQLEAYWTASPGENSNNRDGILYSAADAYRSAGDAADELRVLKIRAARPNPRADVLQRYAELLVSFDPQGVPAAAWSGPDKVRDAVANAAVESGGADLALRAVIARGRGLPAVWTKAYTGLAGLYYRDGTPTVNAAFLDALGNATIGERIDKPVDRDKQLAGGLWFYYGSSYGVYLSALKRPDAEDFLPAEIEQSPADAEAYGRLADRYDENGNSAAAFADYQRALELNPNLGRIYDREAVILWQQGKHDDAIAHWKSAFEQFALRLEKNFYTATREDVVNALGNIGRRRLLAAVREPVGKVVRDYLSRDNGDSPLVQAAVEAAGDPVAGIDWIADLARSADNPVSALESVSNAEWIPVAGRGRILTRLVAIAREQAAVAYGEGRRNKIEALRAYQRRLALWLIDNGQPQAAEAELATMPREEAGWAGAMAAESNSEGSDQPELAGMNEEAGWLSIQLEIRIAAARGTLDALVEKYRREPEKAPPFAALAAAATALREHGDKASALRVLEFAYARALEQRDLAASNFLGLAEVRLEEGNIAGAQALLRRMTMVSGPPFENLEAAAKLLEKFNRDAEAVEFLEAEVHATPWNAQARVDLAVARLKAGQDRVGSLKSLTDAAGQSGAVYQTRVAAAEALGRQNAAALHAGSAELDLLGGPGPIPAENAAKPYFYFARVAAAGHANDPALKVQLLLDAIAIDPHADQTRLALFDAAIAHGRYQLAVSALKPLLQRANLFWMCQDCGPDTGDFPISFDPQREAGNPAMSAAMIQKLGAAYEQLGQLSIARRMYRFALHMEKSDSARAEIGKDIARVKALTKRSSENALRRPQVAQKLEQPGWVLPRLEGREQ